MEQEKDRLQDIVNAAEALNNRFRTKEGHHICECCGVVYVHQINDPVFVLSQPYADHSDWSRTPRIYGEYTGTNKKTAANLLLKEVNGDRFCPHCEKDLRQALEELRFLTNENTRDHNICSSFRLALKRTIEAQKKEKQ